jgi:hypothetical protein
MRALCLFCRRDLEVPGLRTIEHIVPTVLVGKDWLLSEQICGPCNHELGTAVDSVGANAIFIPFLQEAGIAVAPSNELEGIVILTDGDLVRVHMSSDQTSKGKRRVERSPDGRRITITAPTLAEAKEMAEGMSQKGKQRRGAEIKWGAPEHIQDEGPTIVSEEAKRLDELEERLPREVGKIAIEYLGLRYGASIALMPELDPLRQFSRYGTGEPPIGRMGLYYGDRPIYLPRSNQLHQFRETPGDKMSYEEQWRLVVDDEGHPLPPPPDAVPLTHLAHRLWVWRDPGGVHFELTLFSCFGFHLLLPVRLPIYRTRLDLLDLTSGRQRSIRG